MDDIRKCLKTVAALNPDAGEIGDGMLRTIVQHARLALYEYRVQQYEAKGLTRSDAQGVVDAEDMQE